MHNNLNVKSLTDNIMDIDLNNKGKGYDKERDTLSFWNKSATESLKEEM